MKQIGIIGSINRDTVIDLDENVTCDLGGVLYTALGLASLGKDGVETWLIGRLGEDIVSAVRALLSDWPGVRLEGMPVVSVENYHSRIQYFPDGSKTELLTGRMRPLGWEDLEPFLGKWDGLLINFITGFEIAYPTLARVKENFRHPLLMDVHSLTLGRRESGERFWKKPEDWREWLRLVDVVQMNEAEAALLGDFRVGDSRALETFALSLLDLGPRSVALTMGREGVLAASRSEEETKVWRQAAELPERAVDPTGCGDVFLAALGWGEVNGWGFAQTVEIASQVAGLKSRFRGMDGFKEIEERAFG
jgi:sugar/nucleoside kinase (ribokinase family)